eukprot:TRINITY_DN245_c0_g1_i1.p2 TRINITY_DN245_c0_g1~~TRINITY_DN245_c0_g1_i1.p2  ORF type:complete len:582 (+),score=59.65 TRINITY_DN245_c0_g1_i1:6311-8056(+)
MWKNKARRHNIPTAEEVFQAKPAEKIWVFLKEVYDVFAMHDVDIWLKYVINQWAVPILEGYDLAFSKESAEPPHSGLYQDMRDGRILFAIVHYFTEERERATFRDMHKNPETQAELVDNLRMAFEAASNIGIPVWWSPEDFLANPAIHLDFAKQQLYYTYKKLKDLKGFPPSEEELVYRNEPMSPPALSESPPESVNEEEKEIPQGLFSQLITKKLPTVSPRPKYENSRAETGKVAKKMLERIHSKSQMSPDAKSNKHIDERKKMVLEEKCRIENSVNKKKKQELPAHVTNQTAHFPGEPEESIEESDHEDFPIVLKKPELNQSEDEGSLDFSGLDEEMKEILRSDFEPKENASSSPGSEKSERSDYYDSTHENVIDPNFLLSYLMTPQILQLSVNQSKFCPFMFKLVPSPLMHMYFQQHYYFVWTDLETPSVISSLDITHIKDVRRLDNQCCFSVILFTKQDMSKADASPARPLSKVSTVQNNSFVVKCDTPDDCYKYVTGLNYFAEEVRAEFGAMSPSARKSLKRDLALHPVPAAVEQYITPSPVIYTQSAILLQNISIGDYQPTQYQLKQYYRVKWQN